MPVIALTCPSLPVATYINASMHASLSLHVGVSEWAEWSEWEDTSYASEEESYAHVGVVIARCQRHFRHRQRQCIGQASANDGDSNYCKGSILDYNSCG